jgi:mutator protein MutT
MFPERPIVGVGAVIVDGQSVLLVKRAHPPLQGEWSLPGGAVEVGETLHEAVVREVREETGLEVAVGRLVDVVDRVHRTPDGRVEYHFVVVDYLCTPVGGVLAHDSDAAEVCWAAADDLTRYRLTAVAAAVIGKAFELSRRPAAYRDRQA